MDYEDIEVGIKYGLIGALTDKEVCQAVTDMLVGAAEECLLHPDDADYPDRRISTFLRSIDESLKVLADRHTEEDLEYFDKECRYLAHRFRDYCDKINSEPIGPERAYDEGVLHGLGVARSCLSRIRMALFPELVGEDRELKPEDLELKSLADFEDFKDTGDGDLKKRS